jgi:CheY-like chemotaxis protein
MGGSIGVESEVGRGTTFRAVIPVGEAAQPAGASVSSGPQAAGAQPPESTRTEPAEPAGTADGPRATGNLPVDPRLIEIHDDADSLTPGRGTLLVVDDDPGSLYVYRQFLSRLGYQVVFATHGEEVIPKARELRPAAIILDLMLPQKSGWEVLDELKRSDDLKEIPVIISSALDHRERGPCAGAFRYLTKPMSERDVRAVLADLERARNKDVRRVMVVDDDSVDLKIAKILLEKAGVTVLNVQRPDEAVRTALAERPDIILLDLMMPEVDGFEVLSRLKADPATAAIPVLVHTAKEITDEDRKRLEPSARRILQKTPLQIQAILDELGQVLKTLPPAPVPTPACDEPPAGSSTEGAAAEEAAPAGDSGARAVSPLGRILFVEDDPVNQYSIGFILRAEGYEVLLAENGQEGVERAASDRPDVILMDMMMPVMSGFDAARRIKDSPELRDIPIIALTARAMAGERERTLAAGCDDYLSKPIERTLLLERLSYWMGIVEARLPVGAGSPSESPDGPAA